MTSQDLKQKKQQWKKEHGICLICDEKAAEGRRHCKPHLRLRSEIALRYQERNKQKGLCVICGEQALPEYVLCESHQAINNARTVKRARIRRGIPLDWPKGKHWRPSQENKAA